MNQRQTETKANLLATMQALSPPLEKLMADRIALRNEVRSAQSALAETEKQILNLKQVRDVRIPRYIAVAKTAALIATIITLVAFTLSLFTNLFEIKIVTPLFASLPIPLWLVDLAEGHFGRWHLHLDRAPTFAHQTN